MGKAINEKEVSIHLPEENIVINGIITVPSASDLIIVFAHGSGSGRFSPRNQFVAREFVQEGFATLLLDLLTEEEESYDNQTRELRFNIPFLAQRLVDVKLWLNEQEETKNKKIAYFGSSTGAAAALIAAAKDKTNISSIVSRGGRPDLAASVLKRLPIPTLLIVGEHDYGVIELNQEAYDLLPGPKQMSIVPLATHLFEEPGALEQVARLAVSWFKRWS